MWQNTTIFFVFLGILSLIITEILRSVVDRKRLERDGLGGTQDIAIGGMIGVDFVLSVQSSVGWAG